MRKCKAILSIISTFLMIFLIGINVIAANAVSKSEVFDQASLFSETELQDITNQAKALSDSQKMTIVVVTTDDANGKTARAYADDFCMDQGFYELGDNGTVLFLIDMDNREVYISTSGGAERYLTDERIKNIIDAGYDALANGQYKQCISNMLTKAEDFIAKGIPSGQHNYNEETGEVSVYRSLTLVEVLIVFATAVGAGALVCAGVIGKYRLKWGTYRYPFREKSHLRLTVKNDRFINQVVTSRRIPRNPPPGSSGGGGGGGRSTTHTSSGGGSFGGGGRKF